MNNQLNMYNSDIEPIFEEIKLLINNSRNRVYTMVNVEMINLYWNIGKIIMEIQQGNQRASYGDSILEKLSNKLMNEFGKGFSIRNLERMRKFHICFSNSTTLSSNLSWSHYIELIKIEEENKRNFYLKESINSKWSVRELQRQIASLLYERLALSKEKERLTLSLSRTGTHSDLF